MRTVRPPARRGLRGPFQTVRMYLFVPMGDPQQVFHAYNTTANIKVVDDIVAGWCPAFLLGFVVIHTAAGRAPVAGEMARNKNRDPMIFAVIGLILPASVLWEAA